MQDDLRSRIGRCWTTAVGCLLMGCGGGLPAVGWAEGTRASGHTPSAAMVKSLHLDWLDTNADPAVDFFKYANGGWQARNPVPDEYSRWGTFTVIHIQNQKIIRGILEAAASQTNAKPGSVEQKIGDFYASGMDLKTVEAAGIRPLETELRRINGVTNLDTLRLEVLHLQKIGVNALFDFGPMQDFKDSSRMIGVAGQGGLGLPDRDYYLKKDKKFAALRAEYVKHVGRMLGLLGEPAQTASHDAQSVMKIETRLAQASMPRADQRDPRNVYHMMKLEAAEELTPHFSWSAYLREAGHGEIRSINVAMPDFFKGMNQELATVSMKQWRTYLRWHLIDSLAPYLSQPFVKEDFRMTSAISGAKKLRPRWQRVLQAEDQAIGFAVGKAYVEKVFPPSSKRQVLAILHQIRHALEADIGTLSWMGAKTRQAALHKLSLMGERIGYPDKWRDYSKLQVDRGPWVANVMRANAFETRRELNKIGRPVDRHEWYMTPQTVNAYYDPSMNNINFPAGILRPPFFDAHAPAAVNYGALGFVMGHEMTHGFDDEGAQFDGHGNLTNWWTANDLKRFHAATQCIARQFSQYKVNGTLHLNGKLVTGEATADLGGLTLAWRAFHASKAYAQARTIRGLTPDQQFFLGAAHVWASNIRPEEAQRRVTIDPHPPAVDRVNGTLANMPQFQKAFGIPNNSPMVNLNRCRIW